MIHERRKVSPLTDEDADIAGSLRYRRQGRGRGVHAFYRGVMAEAIDADIMQRLARTRRNNKRARAYAEQPGELLS
jgi:hypothetical protein